MVGIAVGEKKSFTIGIHALGLGGQTDTLHRFTMAADTPAYAAKTRNVDIPSCSEVTRLHGHSAPGVSDEQLAHKFLGSCIQD
jgi:hypothetical protein